MGRSTATGAVKRNRGSGDVAVLGTGEADVNRELPQSLGAFDGSGQRGGAAGVGDPLPAVGPAGLYGVGAGRTDYPSIGAIVSEGGGEGYGGDLLTFVFEGTGRRGSLCRASRKGIFYGNDSLHRDAIPQVLNSGNSALLGRAGGAQKQRHYEDKGGQYGNVFFHGFWSSPSSVS